MHEVSTKQLTLLMPASQYCAHQAFRQCHIYIPKSGGYTVRPTALYFGRKGKPYFAHGAENCFTLFCKRISSEIRKLRCLKIVTVRLVPESGEQLAPGAAAFQNGWC